MHSVATRVFESRLLHPPAQGRTLGEESLELDYAYGELTIPTRDVCSNLGLIATVCIAIDNLLGVSYHCELRLHEDVAV